MVPSPQPLVLSERGTPNEQPTHSPWSSAKGGVASEEEKGRMPPLSFLAKTAPAKAGGKATLVKKAAPKKALVAKAKPVAKTPVARKVAPKKAALKKPTAKLGGKKAAR